MASRIFTVDLGAWSVKLAIASPGLRGATLVNVVERLVPAGDEPAEQRARRVLAAMIDELRLRDESGYIGVYGDQAFTQVLEFGFKQLKRADLDKAVGGELEGVVPIDLEEMVYAFEPIPIAPPEVSPDGEAVKPRGRVAAHADGMRVLSYAMRRERAEQLIELGKQCHFETRGILACGGAAARLVERTPSLVKARGDGPVAVIDIGHERTDVVIVAGGKAVYSRSVARGGRQVTDAIAGNWKLSADDAERAKHSDGFVASAGEPATSDAWARIHQVTITELQPFARDLRQTISACRAHTGFVPIAALIVGGGSRLRGIGSFLTEQLAIPVWRPTDDDLSALAGPKIGAVSAISLPIDSAALTIGMAYDAAGGRPQFDLRSGALAVRVDLSFLRAKAVPLCAAMLTICAFAAGSAYADLYALRKSQRTLDARLAADTTEVFKVPKTVDEILGSDKGSNSNAAIAGLVSPLPKNTAYDTMLDISAHMPAADKSTLNIDVMKIDDNSVEIQGSVKKPDELDAVVTGMKQIDCLKDVTRGTTTSEGSGSDEVIKFQVTAKSACMTEGANGGR